MPQKKKGLAPSWEIEPLPSHETSSKEKYPFNLPMYDEVKDEPPPIMNSDKDYHPTDMSEGVLEKLIKFAASKSGSSLRDDKVYLEQYLHPERDIIPKQHLRPSNLKNMPNMEFRRVPDETPLAEMPDYRVPNVGGLGRATITNNKDYGSIYDIWDFDTDAQLIGNRNKNGPLASAANWAAKKFMQNVGTPFAVYERIPKSQEDEDYDEFGQPKKKKGKK